MLDYVPYVPAWSTHPHANVPKACQHSIFTCQRANVPINMSMCQHTKGVPIFQIGGTAWQRRTNFSNWRANVPIFQLCFNFSIFQLCFKRKYFSILQFFNFMVNSCKFQGYLDNSRKFISWNKEFKFLNSTFAPLTYHAYHKSCWKTMHDYETTLGTTVLVRFLIPIPDPRLKQITIQEDHNIYKYSLFCLVVLVVENLFPLKRIETSSFFIFLLLKLEVHWGICMSTYFWRVLSHYFRNKYFWNAVLERIWCRN